MIVVTATTGKQINLIITKSNGKNRNDRDKNSHINSTKVIEAYSCYNDDTAYEEYASENKANNDILSIK